MDVQEPLSKVAENVKLECANSKTRRQAWGNQAESFLAHLGAIIGLGNIWRFPYIVFTYGGGAFLIPYGIFVVFGGFPLLFLEISMGQYTREAAIKAWKIAPILKGIGIGCTFLVTYSSVYYITVMAWSILYFAHSFTLGTLPWMSCENWWNTNSCLPYHKFIYDPSTNISKEAFDISVNSSLLPVIEFWNRYALRKSEGLHEIGSLDNWPMILCLLGSWLIIYFCIFKGIRWSSKVVYFTATFPYVVLAVLLVRGLTLEGSMDGVRFYLQPNMSKLLEPNVWVQACSQVCYSYAICFTALIAFGSYNNFNMDCYKHGIFLSVSCSMTSFIAGFAVFSVLGNMAHVMQKNVSDVVASGPGLAFLTYPTALSLLPLPQLWNALFFFMIILIAVDSQFSCLEGLLTIFYDQWTVLRRHTQLFSGLFCLGLFLFGLIYVTNAGIYFFELFNNFAVSGIALLWMATMESIGAGWVYGADNMFENIKEMIGYYPSVYLRICWKFITPVLLLSVMICYIVMFKPLVIGGYEYPDWANAVGWMMCLSSAVCVPFYAIYELARHPGNFKQRIIAASRPVGMPPTPRLSKGNGASDEFKLSMDLSPSFS